MLSWNQIFGEAGRALGVEPNIVHIASDLIAAYNPGAVGDLIGDKINSAVFDNSKIKRFVPDFNAKCPGPKACAAPSPGTKPTRRARRSTPR